MARLMVGREVLLRVEKPDADAGTTQLTVKNLFVTSATGARRVNDVSFEVRKGEILGIAGVEGNGQTELIEALAGLVPAAQVQGEVTLEGRNITRLGARTRREFLCDKTNHPADQPRGGGVSGLMLTRVATHERQASGSSDLRSASARTPVSE